VNHRNTWIACAAAASMLPWFACAANATGNQFNVKISTNATRSVTFANGVFTPTADNANLNVTDLTNALASGNIEVATGNSGEGTMDGDIHVAAGFTWASANTLTLDAYHTIYIEQAVVDAGTGGLTLTTNDGGTDGQLTFQPTGSISFLGTSNALSIDGNTYTLANSVAALASDIASNPSGYFALAGSYDASKDGTYPGAPIGTTFMGTFEGLGNTISNLSISGTQVASLGLFLEIAEGGVIDSARLANVSIESNINLSSDTIGAVAADSTGTITATSVTGEISFAGEGGHDIGGLVGENGGKISGASSSVAVQGPESHGQIFAGGLIGTNDGVVATSSATGQVLIRGSFSAAGGLIGSNEGRVDESYATGSVSCTNLSSAGGLIGESGGGNVANSYATGNVHCHHSAVGGFVGEAQKGHYFFSYSTGRPSDAIPPYAVGGFAELFTAGSAHAKHSYWDTTTSKTDNGTGDGNVAGITGLSTLQLQSGLPNGFDPAIWAENPSINNGFPYLIANPPPQ